MVKMLRPKVSPLRSAGPRALTVSATRRTRGSAWMATRDRILARDCGLCQVCLHFDRVTLARDVDHIVELADGGTDDDDNLQGICGTCHPIKSAEAERARRAGLPLLSRAAVLVVLLPAVRAAWVARAGQPLALSDR